jgi:hypothetical protein
MRRLWIGLVLILVLLAAGRGDAAAMDIRQGDQCVIAVDETVHGDLFALCRTLNIKGHIEGNVFAAATDAVITGAVDGDVYLAAGQLDAAGTFGGNLHFGGPVLRILSGAQFNSETAHLVSLSLSTTLDEGVALPGGIVAGGYQLVLNGTTSGEVNFWGSALTITGSVDQDVNAVVGDPESKGISQLQTLLIPFNWDVTLINPGLTLTKSGTVGGDLHYSGPVEGSIEGQIAGKTDFNQLVTQPDLTQIISEQESTNLYLSEVGAEFAVLALIGLIGLLFLPRLLQTPLRHIYSRPLPSVGVGLLAFIVSFPIVLIILLFIVIIIAILVLLRLDSLVVAIFGVALVGTWSGGASVFYFTAIFISRVLLCLVVGRALVRLVRKDNATPLMMILNLLVGVLVLSALMSLPVVGLIVSAVAAFLGLGAIIISIQAQVRTYRESLVSLPPNMPHYTGRLGGPRSLPPPKLNDEPKPPGMENLPEGFEFWDE